MVCQHLEARAPVVVAFSVHTIGHNKCICSNLTPVPYQLHVRKSIFIWLIMYKYVSNIVCLGCVAIAIKSIRKKNKFQSLGMEMYRVRVSFELETSRTIEWEKNRNSLIHSNNRFMLMYDTIMWKEQQNHKVFYLLLSCFCKCVRFVMSLSSLFFGVRSASFDKCTHSLEIVAIGNG